MWCWGPELCIGITAAQSRAEHGVYRDSMAAVWEHPPPPSQAREVFTVPGEGPYTRADSLLKAQLALSQLTIKTL